MKRTLTLQVIGSTLIDDSTVEITLAGGWTIAFSTLNPVPNVGQLIRAELGWGEDYYAPVVPIIKGDLKRYG